MAEWRKRKEISIPGVPSGVVQEGTAAVQPYRCVQVFPSAEAKRRKKRVAEEKEKQQRDGRSRVALVGGSATERTKDPATPEDPTQRCG